MGIASIGGALGVYYLEGEEVSTGWNGPRGVEVSQCGSAASKEMEVP